MSHRFFQFFTIFEKLSRLFSKKEFFNFLLIISRRNRLHLTKFSFYLHVVTMSLLKYFVENVLSKRTPKKFLIAFLEILECFHAFITKCFTLPLIKSVLVLMYLINNYFQYLLMSVYFSKTLLFCNQFDIFMKKKHNSCCKILANIVKN